MPVGKSWNPKLACALALVLVFLCGAAAGAVAMNLGVHKSLHQPAFDTPAGKARYFERMRKELDLTPAQAEQIAVGAERFLAVLPHRAERQQAAGGAVAERGAAQEIRNPAAAATAPLICELVSPWWRGHSPLTMAQTIVYTGTARPGQSR